jgi:hypothetical protein
VEKMVFKPMVSVVVAEGHDEERKKERTCCKKNRGGETDF